MKALESLSIIAVALLGCGADGSGADARDAPDTPAQDSTVDPRPDTSVARDAGPFAKNPTLAGLPDNTALDLGEYSCRERLPQIADYCETIVDFSRFNYDPYHHRILMFGGGHAATGRTDLDAFSFSTLAWNSLYPSMSCADVMRGDIDPRGFHRGTGHPAARHTYDMSVVGEVDGVGRLFLLSTEGFSGWCHPYGSPMESVASYPLTSSVSRWGYSVRFTLPWLYAAAADFDPVSGMVIVIGSTMEAGAGGMWVYSPKLEKVVAFVSSAPYEGLDDNLLYYPPNQRLYLIEHGAPYRVREIELDRSDWARSKARLLAISGPALSGGRATGWAYDSAHELFGGGVTNGMFHLFDPKTSEWKWLRMNVRSSSGASPGTVQAHLLDYDPVNNVFFFIAEGPQGFRTWAYRYRP